MSSAECIVSCTGYQNQMVTFFDELELIEEECGEATVFFKPTNSPCKIIIKKQRIGLAHFGISAYLSHPAESDCKTLGTIFFHISPTNVLKPYLPASALKDDPFGAKRHVFVHMIRSLYNETYKGVGTVLLQCAMEEGYLQGCEGRMVLEAVWSSHAFHYQQGLRSKNWETNLKIANIVRKNKKSGAWEDTGGLGFLNMYLPSDGIARWKERIKEHPLLQ